MGQTVQSLRMEWPAINVSMAYPHLRRLEEPLISELVEFLETIVAIPSRGRRMGLGATMLLGFIGLQARIVSISHSFCMRIRF